MVLRHVSDSCQLMAWRFHLHCIQHLPTTCISVFGIFSFTVRVSILLYFSAFAYSLRSLLILVFIPQLHKKSKIFKWLYLYIFGLLKLSKKSVFFFDPQLLKTKNISRFAIWRYNLSETTIYKPSLQGRGPVFHACQTKWISALSTSFSHWHIWNTATTASWLLLNPTHTTKRHTAGQRGITFTNVSAKVEMQRLYMTAWPLGRSAGTSVSFMTGSGEELVHLGQRGEKHFGVRRHLVFFMWHSTLVFTRVESAHHRIDDILEIS